MGSEMCIRDRGFELDGVRLCSFGCCLGAGAGAGAGVAAAGGISSMSVSSSSSELWTNSADLILLSTLTGAFPPVFFVTRPVRVLLVFLGLVGRLIGSLSRGFCAVEVVLVAGADALARSESLSLPESSALTLPSGAAGFWGGPVRRFKPVSYTHLTLPTICSV